MDKAFRDILDLICGNTALAIATSIVGALFLVWVLAHGASLDALLVFGLGELTAVTEFRRENTMKIARSRRQ